MVNRIDRDIQPKKYPEPQGWPIFNAIKLLLYSGLMFGHRLKDSDKVLAVGESVDARGTTRGTVTFGDKSSRRPFGIISSRESAVVTTRTASLLDADGQPQSEAVIAWNRQTTDVRVGGATFDSAGKRIELKPDSPEALTNANEVLGILWQESK